MQWRRLLAAAVVLTSLVGAWRLASRPEGRAHSTAIGSEPGEPSRVETPYFDHIADADDPYRAALRERGHVLRAPSEALARCRQAWNSGEYDVACAVFSVLREAGAPALAWLAEQEDSGGEDSRRVAAVLARWYVDADSKRAVSALAAIQLSWESESTTFALAAIHRMRASGVPVVAHLVELSDGADGIGALGLLQALGEEAAEAVPALVALADRLAAQWNDRPIFGVDERGSLQEATLRALVELGQDGVNACIRLLYSEFADVGLALLVLVDQPHRLRVADVIRRRPDDKRPIPAAVLDLLAHLPRSQVEWDQALRFASTAPDSARLALLDALCERDVEADAGHQVVEALLSWSVEDSEVVERRLDVLVKLGPQDPRVRGLVHRVLATGRVEEKIGMLRRIASRLLRFPPSTASAASALMASDDLRLRVAVLGLVANSGEAIGDQQALGLIGAGLDDADEGVAIAAMQALAARGRTGAPLANAAIARFSDGSPRMQLALLRAVTKARLHSHKVRVQARRAWAAASESEAVHEFREEIVGLLEEHQGSEWFVAALAADFLKTESLAPAIHERLRALARRP